MGVAASLSVYYNYSGNATCYTLGSADGNLGDAGWNFQASHRGRATKTLMILLLAIVFPEYF